MYRRIDHQCRLCQTCIVRTNDRLHTASHVQHGIGQTSNQRLSQVKNAVETTAQTDKRTDLADRQECAINIRFGAIA